MANKITKKEILGRIKWLVLLISGIYISTPVKSFVDNIFLGEILPENTTKMFIIGMVMILITLYLFKLEK